MPASSVFSFSRVVALSLASSSSSRTPAMSPSSAVRKSEGQGEGEYEYEYEPRGVVLLRTPYKRENWLQAGRVYAERGYHCLVQDTRGRFGSSGDFFPVAHEVT